MSSTGGAGCATASTSPSSQQDTSVAKWNMDEFSSDPSVFVASAECSQDAPRSQAL